MSSSVCASSSSVEAVERERLPATLLCGVFMTVIGGGGRAGGDEG